VRSKKITKEQIFTAEFFSIGTIFHSDEKILIKKSQLSSANQITPF
jgi:hypothetical protein